MRDDTPSRTAFMVAVQRAAHQTIDHPPLFDDPFAARIIGERGRAMLATRRVRKSWFGPYLRAVLAARSVIAERELAASVENGVTQYVVLGAGLDTFALRNPYPALRVFEVDHPSTQGWKRKLLANEGLTAPATLTFVPVDFERQDVATELRKAGLDPTQPTFFSWLGVVMYLRPDAIDATLRTVVSLRGSEGAGGIVFDFFRRPERTNVVLRFLFWLRGRWLARVGEPFRTFFAADELREKLSALGFTRVEILAPSDINARFFTGRPDRLRVSPIAHIAIAR
jgi:methyltransferase (TIGR00027 family)